MRQIDLDRLQRNIQAASTEDLLDRVTHFREGMEIEAIDWIERELRRRGVTAAQQAAHAERLPVEVLRDRYGLPCRCALCRRPAIARNWRWLKLFGCVPVFPRWTALCQKHANGLSQTGQNQDTANEQQPDTR